MELTTFDSMTLSHAVKNDAEFLASHNLMDYSLLLVVESCIDFLPTDDDFTNFKRIKREQTSNLNVKYRGQVYHLGIIDYL